MLVKFEKKYWNKWVGFIRKCWPAQNDDCFDFEYDMERNFIIESKYDELKDNVILVIENNYIVGYFHKGETLGFDLFCLGNCHDGYEEFCLSSLKESYPEALLSGGYGYDEVIAQDKVGYKTVNFTSKFGGKYSGQMPMTAGDINAYVNKVDELVFPEISDKLEFSVMKGRELSDFIASGVILYNHNTPCWDHRIAGFNYLSYDNMFDTDRDIKFLVCYVGKTVVGVIHFGIWYPGSQDISFIDVAKPYRNMGIATKMIKELNKYLDTNIPLQLTRESEMGAKCKISEKFKKYITVVPVKTHVEVYGY